MLGRTIAGIAVFAALAMAGPHGSSALAGTGATGDSPALPGPQPDSSGGDRAMRRLAPGGAQVTPLRKIDCVRWQSLTLQLGETLAGRRMRQTAAGERCRQLGDAGVPVWDWPWAGGELTAELPPQIVLEAGGWQVRCDAAGRRRRCALVHQPAVDVGNGEGVAGQSGAMARHIGAERVGHISTHFVIDRIAGRESVLWRVFVPAEQRPATVAARGLDDSTPQGTPSAEPLPPHLRILGERSDKLAERTGYCSSAGCLIEAGPQRSADIANRLADGGSIDVRIDGAGLSSGAVVAIPSQGFRAAFRELVRQRREEERLQR